MTNSCDCGNECIVFDVSKLADPRMADCNTFYRLPDGSIWLLNKEGDGYQEVFVANDDLPKIDWNADPDSDAGISNRPFKAIGWGLTTDDDGNIMLDQLVLPEADWDVTDPTDIDYIKNKPFQTLGNRLSVDEDGQLNVCLINNTNLLPNSTWNLGEGSWTFDVGTGSTFEILDPERDKPQSHILHAKPTTSASQQLSNLPHPIYVHTGETYTLAFDYKENQVPISMTRSIFSLRVFQDRDTVNNQVNALWFENIYHSFLEETHPAPILEFDRFTYTFTAGADGWLDPVVYDSDTSGTHESWWRELMIIHGTACEMPEDWHAYSGDNAGGDVILYPTTGDKTDGAMTQKATTDELNKRFTDKGALPKPTDMNTLTTAGSYSMSNFVAGTDVTNHPALAVDSGGKCYALILVFRNSDRPVVTQFWFTSSTSTPKPTFFFRTQTQQPLTWSDWEQLDNQGGVDLSKYVTLDTEQTILANKSFGEIVTTGKGKDGQVTTIGEDGSVTQIQKIAGSDEYTTITIGSGMVEVQRLKSDGTPVTTAILTENGVELSTDIDWTELTDRQNGFSGGVIKYKRENNVVTVVGDLIVPPAMTKYKNLNICNLPAVVRPTTNARAICEVSNVPMVIYISPTTGSVAFKAADTIQTDMHVGFTATYIL